LESETPKWGEDPMDFKMMRSQLVALRQFRTML
jgi:hypothetical protein